MDSHNNLHSFVFGHYNHAHCIGINNIDALIWQEKLFFPIFSLLLKFIYKMRLAWILVIISILFVMSTTVKFTSLGNKILMLWICKKSFLSTIFHITNGHPWNETHMILIIISIVFVMGTTIMFSTLGYMILILWFGEKSFSLYHFPYN